MSALPEAIDSFYRELQRLLLTHVIACSLHRDMRLLAVVEATFFMGILSR